MKFRFAFEPSRFGVTENPQQALGDGWQRKIFEAVLSQVASSIYPQGVKGIEARSINRILQAVDAAEQDCLELERGDLELLNRMLWHDNAAVPLPMIRAFCLLQESAKDALDAH